MALQIGQNAIVITLTIAGPLLFVGLVVGLMVGVFQAVTQVHEMTLTFIPKILAIAATLLMLLPWFLIKLIDFTVDLFNMIPMVVR